MDVDNSAAPRPGPLIHVMAARDGAVLCKTMPDAAKDLIRAFREDHAVLGRGFYELSTALRGRDLEAARAAARRLNEEAGPHIAFEELHFYPQLEPLLGKDEVARLYAEHGLGLGVVRRLLAAKQTAKLSEADYAALIEDSEVMERHITECGELFAAMGRIPVAQQERLLRELEELRRQKPSWLAHAETAQAP